MNKDREHIQELFDNDGIKAPDSLSEDSILSMLESEDSGKSEPRQAGNFKERKARDSRHMRKIMSAAAALLVAAAGIAGFAHLASAPPDTSAAGGELYTFKNEREIKNTLKELSGQHPGIDLGKEVLLDYETPVAEGEAVSSDTSMSKSSDVSHSETYLQVDEVDEADIVKTDGKYIYYVTDTREVIILSAENGKTKRLSTIGSSGIENYIDDIYVSDDRLITVGSFYKDDSNEENSGIVVYDISDRSDPQLISDFSQTGSILTSRMTGNYVYLVTNDFIYDDRSVPECGSGSIKKLDASDICCMPHPQTPSYIVLSAIDVSAGSQGKAVTKAVLGAGSEIYCNDHNLYCTSYEYDEKDATAYTRIVRASLDGTKVKFNSTNRVRGYINDQFSMDESDGYFRIATTSERAGIDVNNLYVLDADLKETGKVTGFARNESIRSVRFVADKAYVITYEEIDPLFIIDLSDPADPRIEGEVKIDGFSTLLIPVSKGRLLGIGHATGDNGYGGEYDSGLKLALFDISDPSQPKVLDSREFENMSSPAQYDHHALMVNSDDGYYAVPYEIWDYSIDDGGVIMEDEESFAEEDVLYEPEAAYETGVLLFEAGDSISSADKHALEGNQISRCVYIGDWIYALDGEGNVQSFRPSF